MSLPVWLIWLILCGVFLLIEIFTVSFLMFWPGIGAIFAFIASVLGASVSVQIAIFAISTTLMIVFMKPLVKKLFKTRDVPMNSDAIIGKNGIVIKEVDNIKSKGQVKVNGELWSAINLEDNEKIETGATIIVEDVEGVKLKIKKV
jgi:membrane protein implicated in regulation of membrane protease activity